MYVCTHIYIWGIPNLWPMEFPAAQSKSPTRLKSKFTFFSFTLALLFPPPSPPLPFQLGMTCFLSYVHGENRGQIILRNNHIFLRGAFFFIRNCVRERLHELEKGLLLALIPKNLLHTAQNWSRERALRSLKLH